MLQSVIRNPSQAAIGEIKSVILRSNTLAPVVLLVVLFLVQFSLAQNATAPKDQTTNPVTAPSPTAKETKAKDSKAKGKDEKTQAAPPKDSKAPVTGEAVAESTIYIYGLGGGRAVLNQIRKTAIERGKINVTNAEGRTDQATYARWTQRADGCIAVSAVAPATDIEVTQSTVCRRRALAALRQAPIELLTPALALRARAGARRFPLHSGPCALSLERRDDR